MIKIYIEQSIIVKNEELAVARSLFSWDVYLVKGDAELHLRNFDSGGFFGHAGTDAYPEALEFAMSLCSMFGLEPGKTIVKVIGRDTRNYKDWIEHKQVVKKQKRAQLEAELAALKD